MGEASSWPVPARAMGGAGGESRVAAAFLSHGGVLVASASPFVGGKVRSSGESQVKLRSPVGLESVGAVMACGGAAAAAMVGGPADNASSAVDCSRAWKSFLLIPIETPSSL
eukprot:scaffold4205_cov105-Isochrysis_galbana.AAC.2